jgi:hypothetical protein
LAHRRRGALGVNAIKFVADGSQLPLFELRDAVPRQRSAARISAAYISFKTARSPKACGITLVRRRSSPNSRSSRLVVRIARR